VQALELFRGRRLVDEACRGRAGSRAEDEAERSVEAHVLDEVHGLFEIRGGFAGEAHDEIAGNRDVGACGAELRTIALYSIAV